MTRKAPLIVIVSDKDDAHVPYVSRHLTLPFVIVDPSQIPNNVELSYTMENGLLQVVYDGAILGSNVKSVWWRKPQDLAMEVLPVSADYRDYAHSALQGHVDIIKGMFPDALWVSDYWQIKRAANKPLQLQAARQIGFSTPDTLMTSSNEAARRFIARHKQVIVKSLAKVFISSPAGRPLAFFARKITLQDEASLEGLCLAPAIFQELVDAKVDIRVTVVGDKVFAATIKGSAIDKTGSPIRDWKIAHCEGDMAIEAYDLPADIARMCIEHVKIMGLQFGAIDLVLDKNGKYWFLENNSNGQWAFVEEKTGQPIGKAIAELLVSG